MYYWKIVDAGDYKTYANKLLNLFLREYNTYFIPVNLFWNPVKPSRLNSLLSSIIELDEVTKKFGPFKELAVLFLGNDGSSLHIDHTTGLNTGVKARLNIPVVNCKGSYTSFFEIPKEIFDLHHTDSSGTKAWSQYFRNNLIPVTSVELAQPTVLRTSAPHTVFCRACQFPRISLTMSFETDIVHVLND